MVCPSGDQSGSSSIRSWLLVMFTGAAVPASRSSTLTTKMSLSLVAEPGSVLIGVPVPDADAWNAMSLQSGDHVAELPRVRNVCPLPSAFIKNRSETLTCPDNRSLSNTIRTSAASERPADLGRHGLLLGRDDRRRRAHRR